MLPIQLDSLHLVNPFLDPCGGSEWRTLTLHRLLQTHTAARLWSEGTPHKSLSSFPISPIKPYSGQYPTDGTLVIVGAYFRLGPWLAHTHFKRVVLVYNTYHHEQLYAALRHYRDLGLDKIELVFASNSLRRMSCLEGTVQLSPIDVTRFRAVDTRHDDIIRPFTVGRLSRDVNYKHHSLDPALYRRLVANGCRVRIMGALCLSRSLASVPEIQCLPAGSESAESFLRTLDCFYYRTRPDFTESFGRVIAEAMAVGLPIVAHRDGDYREYLQDGKTAILFGSDNEAFEALMFLKENPESRRALGIAASAAARTQYEITEKQIISYYVPGGAATAIST